MSSGIAKATAKGSPWYPTSSEVNDPRQLGITLRRILDQHYSLANRVAAGSGGATSTPLASGTAGPGDSMLLGLHVEPVDTSTLADGATLKYSKVRGTLYFS